MVYGPAMGTTTFAFRSFAIALALVAVACSPGGADDEDAAVSASRSSLDAVTSPDGTFEAVFFRASGGGAAGWGATDIWVGPAGDWVDGDSTYDPVMDLRAWRILCDVEFTWLEPDSLQVAYALEPSVDDAEPGLVGTPPEVGGIQIDYVRASLPGCEG